MTLDCRKFLPNKLKIFEHYLNKPGYIMGFQREYDLGYTAIALLQVKGKKYTLVDQIFLAHGNSYPWPWRKLKIVG